MEDRFPWMLALPEEDRRACAEELIAAGLDAQPVEGLEAGTVLERP